ncbi:MAG: hypothetical protein AAF740_00670 [Bacteroidota bacterium]
MKGQLTIKRFNGLEIWELEKGSFSVTPHQRGVIVNFWARSSGKLLSAPLEDTRVDGTPVLELQTLLDKSCVNDFIGLDIDIKLKDQPDDRDLLFANFYYYSHDTPFFNQLSVKEVRGELYHIVSISSLDDVNYYDGSKPENQIIIDCWIKKSTERNGYWVL